QRSCYFFFSSRRRHTRFSRDWSSDVCSSDLKMGEAPDVLLVDYHLHDRLDGLDTLDALRAGHPHLPGALLTADGSDPLKRAAREIGRASCRERVSSSASADCRKIKQRVARHD